MSVFHTFFQLYSIMATKEAYVLSAIARQFAQPILVEQPSVAINLHHPLIGLHAWRASRRGVHLMAIEVGIACVEQPTLSSLNSDSCIPGGMQEPPPSRCRRRASPLPRCGAP